MTTPGAKRENPDPSQADAAEAPEAAAMPPQVPSLSEVATTSPIGSRLAARSATGGAVPRRPVPPAGGSAPAQPEIVLPSRRGPSNHLGLDKASAPAVAKDLPTVNAARFHLRHLILFLLFILLVVVPPGLYGTYLYTVAADRYESDLGFGSRTEETANAFDMLGVLGTSGTSSRDMDILNQVVTSQGLIERVDARLDLRKLYSRYPEDWLFSFPADGPIEDLVDYWGRMVVVNYNASTGLMKLEIFAFTPEDAQAIAQATLEEATQIINDLSKTAQEDTTRYSRDVLATAEERFRNAQNKLTEFRIRNRIVDPQTQLAGASQVINSLVQQLGEAEINLDLLQGTVPDNDPRIAQLNRRIEVIQNRISAETAKVGDLGNPDDEGYAQLIRDYQNLLMEQEFAQKAYLAAQGAYDQAVTDAQQRTRYLATFLQPTLAQSATAPDRPVHIALTAFAGLLLWSILSLVYYALRDRR